MVVFKVVGGHSFTLTVKRSLGTIWGTTEFWQVQNELPAADNRNPNKYKCHICILFIDIRKTIAEIETNWIITEINNINFLLIRSTKTPTITPIKILGSISTARIVLIANAEWLISYINNGNAIIYICNPKFENIFPSHSRKKF